MAMRVGLRLRASTRGLAPFWSCLARCAATVMKRNLLSTFFGRIRCDMARQLSLLGGKVPRICCASGSTRLVRQRAARMTDLRLLDAVLEVLVDDGVLVLAVEAQLLAARPASRRWKLPSSSGPRPAQPALEGRVRRRAG